MRLLPGLGLLMTGNVYPSVSVIVDVLIVLRASLRNDTLTLLETGYFFANFFNYSCEINSDYDRPCLNERCTSPKMLACGLVKGLCVCQLLTGSSSPLGSGFNC